MLQPLRDRLARVSRQREPVTVVSLAADGDLAAPPVDVVQTEPGPQPHPGQQDQHRQVPAPSGALAVTR